MDFEAIQTQEIEYGVIGWLTISAKEVQQY